MKMARNYVITSISAILLFAIICMIISNYRASQALALQRYLPDQLILQSNNPPHILSAMEINEAIRIAQSQYHMVSAIVYVCNDDKYGYCIYVESSPFVEGSFVRSQDGPRGDLTENEINAIKMRSQKYFLGNRDHK